jgi:hypothetical protein
MCRGKFAVRGQRDGMGIKASSRAIIGGEARLVAGARVHSAGSASAQPQSEEGIR